MKINHLYKSSRPARFVLGENKADGRQREQVRRCRGRELERAPSRFSILPLSFWFLFAVWTLRAGPITLASRRSSFVLALVRSPAFSKARVSPANTREPITRLSLTHGCSSLNMVNHVWSAKRIGIRKREDTSAEACRVAGDRAWKRCRAPTLIRDFDLKL